MSATSLARVCAALPDGELITSTGPDDLTISGISQDSRSVEPGHLFVCVPGATVDGHDYVPEALERGARALLVEHSLESELIGVDPQPAEIRVRSARRCVGPVAAEVFGHPSRSMRVIGITGTNGKTTTSHLVAAAMSSEPGGADIGGVEIIGTLSGARTTPEAVELQGRLARFSAEGIDTVVMEVSSHALAMSRVDGVGFAAVVFTNLGIDHLDLHGSVEEYFEAKARLFDPRFSDLAIINRDDPRGRDLIERVSESMTVVDFSVDDVEILELGIARLRLRWKGHDVRVPLGGRFNVSNVVAALTVAGALGVDPAQAAARIGSVGVIDGRFEVFGGADDRLPTVVVDYAHTPDGLEVLLDTIRASAEGAAVVLVFGCGGDRDQQKRPLMGHVAVRGADRVIITTDNPRSEPPEQIVEQILAGIPGPDRARVSVDDDRRSAIASAIESVGVGDIVVVAGKGHERTQDIDGVQHHFDDREVVAELLAEAGQRAEEGGRS
jgi:UDP-N-acetylmuramoyl-L-alanyl-D-glutamate--2,6-diaminopimelate ligase